MKSIYRLFLVLAVVIGLFMVAVALVLSVRTMLKYHWEIL